MVFRTPSYVLWGVLSSVCTRLVCDRSLFSATFQAFVLPMPLCGVSHKLPYCVVITSIFLKIWNGRESRNDIKAWSTASIVLFQDFQRGTIMYCNHLSRIDSSIKPRHLIQLDATVSMIFAKSLSS